MHRIFPILILLLCCFSGWSSAQQKNFSIAPEPSWLVPYKPDLKQAPDDRDVSNGYYMLLFEEQQHVEHAAVYHHEIKQIISEAGIQNAAAININYDPVYETLRFHKILLRRKGKLINQLQASKFKFLQQEDDLSRFIYSGVYTAYCILDDVRKGDQIEIAYTIEGNNPIFEHKFTSLFYLAYPSPIVNFHRSIITSPSREIFFKTFNAASMPDRQMINGMQVYKWEMTNVRAPESEEDAPSWYDNYPTVQATEYRDWMEVINWGDRVNKVPPPGAALQTKIAELKREARNNKEAYMLKAIRFVQDDIRYMGIEMGEYSHRPNTPDKILMQRFGDCKDKSLLLTTMLKANGIYASMAYVDSYMKGHVADYLPAPDIFDHAIVYAKLKDKEYWIDATSSFQRGGLDMLTVSDFQLGLIIDPKGTNGFTPVKNNGAGKTIIHEHFQLPADHQHKGALTVTSVFTMQYADDQRDLLANSSRKDNENTFLDYYKNIYGSVAIDSSLRITDDEKNDRIEIHESYVLNTPWKTDSTKVDGIDFNVRANLLKDVLPAYAEEEDKKTAPLEMRYPFSQDYTITIELPSPWKVSEEELHIKNDYYALHFVPSVKDNIVTLHYTFETYQDHIPVSFMETYIKDRKQIDDFLGFKFSWDAEEKIPEEIPSEGFNWMIFGLTAFFAAVFIHFAMRFYKISLEPVYTSDQLPGLNGFLILIAIGIFIMPVRLFISLITLNIFDGNIWLHLDKVTNVTHSTSLLQLLLVLELAGMICLLVFSLLLVSLLLNRRDTFPMAFVGFIAFSLVFDLADILVFKFVYTRNDWDPTWISAIATGCISAAIFIPYMLLSEQVKATFIMPYKK